MLLVDSFTKGQQRGIFFVVTLNKLLNKQSNRPDAVVMEYEWTQEMVKTG